MSKKIVKPRSFQIMNQRMNDDGKSCIYTVKDSRKKCSRFESNRTITICVASPKLAKVVFTQARKHGIFISVAGISELKR